ncbi:MAG TPA: ParB/RepB/Spo0J family partition protein [Actinocrinis sp.]|uniref:ParB/RepB/Spo0J family partition protein n=1 Tax=Actinocrinis sp. TaxID=1920516 RepID=UPI002DDCC637|nr:ParB/RepB/Spo0J family partition protein [Actinocrinis sp.]HEV2345294.1 ParB/RepB/Spo0J family partition protein [Actinocrinis sp.]
MIEDTSYAGSVLVGYRPAASGEAGAGDGPDHQDSELRARAPAPRDPDQRDGRWLRGAAAGRGAVRVPLSALLAGESPRLDGQDAAHIARLVEVDGPLPPILVERRTMRVIDGTHRLMAAAFKGQGTIDVEFYDGSSEDAFLLAVQANVTHGFPLSQADRRAAAARIIKTHPHLSDRAIAEVAGLGAKTVASLRRRSDDAGPPQTARMGRDGRVRPLDNAEGRRKVAELIASRPDASLREVARGAGVSPATAADVRKRLNQGQDPVPARSAKVRAAGRVPEPVPASVLDKLLRDPALRHNEEGRRLLGLLRQSALGPQEWSSLIAVVPPHSASLVGRLAEHYAQMWMSFAQELKDKAQAT